MPGQWRWRWRWSRDFDFTGVVFDCRVSFEGAKFSSDRIDFSRAEFSGAQVGFRAPHFPAGRSTSAEPRTGRIGHGSAGMARPTGGCCCCLTNRTPQYLKEPLEELRVPRRLGLDAVGVATARPMAAVGLSQSPFTDRPSVGRGQPAASDQGSRVLGAQHPLEDGQQRGGLVPGPASPTSPAPASSCRTTAESSPN